MKHKFVRLVADGGNQNSIDGEQGAVLPIIAVILLAVMMVFAFVIDVPSEEIISKQLQAAADAASLAGAGQLNGTKEGFGRAKKAAIAALRENRINGATLDLSDNPSFQLTHGDVYNETLDGSSYSGTSGTSGNLKITVERGLYWSSLDGTGYEFISLEKDSSGKKFGLPLATFANAVQVSIGIDDVDTFFAKVMGVAKFQPITRLAKAVNDSELERDVAPFAVRACDLLLDTRPSVMSGDHLTDSYQPKSQCERNAILFREPFWDDAGSPDSPPPGYTVNSTPTSTSTIRRDGYWRSELAQGRPTYRRGDSKVEDACFPVNTGTGTYLNCKALPMSGILGIPGEGKTYEEAKAQNILSALSGSRLMARVGQRFRPLHDPRELWNPVKKDGKNANDVLASWINGGNNMLQTEYYSGDAPNDEFPWLRRTGPSNDPNLFSRTFWPDPSGRKQSFVLQTYNQNQWTNPMCHADGVAVNNRATAKVRPSWVPVLAATKRVGGQDTLYCDWGKIFADKDPTSVPVVKSTEPRIIGFMKINAYDGNFLDLDKAFPATAPSTSTPIARDPSSGLTISDSNPAKLEMNGDTFPPLKELKNKIRDFREKQEHHWDCVRDTHTTCSSNRPTPPDITSLFDSNAWYSKCFQFFPTVGGRTPLFGAGGTFTSALGQYGGIHRNYLIGTPQPCFTKWCTPKTLYNWGSGAKNAFDAYFDQLERLTDQPISAIPGAHCMPVPAAEQLDLDKPTSWEKMQPVPAGVGCGGVKATLDQCSGEISFSTGKTTAENRPALVN